MILRASVLLAALLGAQLLGAHAIVASALAQNAAPARRERAAKPAATPAAQPESDGEEAHARPGAAGPSGGGRADGRGAGRPPGDAGGGVRRLGQCLRRRPGPSDRICYAITQPKTRLPASLKRDAAYLFVTVRKAENLPNEVALILGFAARAGAQAASAGARGGTDPAMIVGTTTYGLVVKEANAWLSNPADEPKAVGG